MKLKFELDELSRKLFLDTFTLTIAQSIGSFKHKEENLKGEIPTLKQQDGKNHTILKLEKAAKRSTSLMNEQSNRNNKLTKGVEGAEEELRTTR